jgi:hypothetical protein
MLQGKRNKDCDITTNWDDAHNPLCFMRSSVQRFAIGPSKLAIHGRSQESDACRPH